MNLNTVADCKKRQKELITKIYKGLFPIIVVMFIIPLISYEMQWMVTAIITIPYIWVVTQYYYIKNKLTDIKAERYDLLYEGQQILKKYIFITDVTTILINDECFYILGDDICPPLDIGRLLEFNSYLNKHYVLEELYYNMWLNKTALFNEFLESE